MKLAKALLLASLVASVHAQNPAPKEVENVHPDAHAFYLDLHQNPELSAHENPNCSEVGGPVA
jgi:hypothetical protein